MSPRTGRPPKAESSRNKSLNIRLTADELRRIEACSNVLGKSRTDTLMQGIFLIEENLKK